MRKKQQINMYRNIAVVALVIIGVVIMVFVLRTMNDSPVLPTDFLASYRTAALHSEQVVAMTDAVHEKIKRINDLDMKGEQEKALALIREASKDNVQAREETLRLSISLEELVQQLAVITSARTRKIAFEAIEIEIALTHEFLSYTKSLNEFLSALSTAIVTNEAEERRLVEERLIEVNRKREKINEFNDQFIVKVKKLGLTREQ